MSGKKCLINAALSNVLPSYNSIGPYIILYGRIHFSRVNRDSIGVNISEQKSGTERTKKHKKRELIFFTLPGGATGTVVHRLRGFCPSHDNLGCRYPGAYAARTNFAAAKHTTFLQFCRANSLRQEHWKLDAESYELHLTLNIERIFPARNTHTKNGTF